MTPITLDAQAANQLNNLTQTVELCDPSGRILGRFTPAFDPSEWEVVGPEPTEEELTRREQETESYSTEEVLAYLEGLSCSESDGNAPQ